MDFDELLGLVGSPQSRLRVCSDSRRVGKGDVFVATAGTKADGHNFIKEAVTSSVKGRRTCKGRR